MGIYSNYSLNSNGSEDRETLDMIMMDESVLPYDADNEVEAGFDIIYTMNENYNAICYHIGVNELTAIEETGTPLVYTESVFSSIFNAIKNFLKKIWERIKALFKRFMMIIDGYSKSDKAFVNKYRKDIFAVKNLSDFSFKGYKWTINTNKISEMMGVCKTSSNEFRSKIGNIEELDKLGNDEELKKKIENFDDLVEGYRGDILQIYPKGKKGKYTSEEFGKELKALFRNGEESKEELDGSKDINVHDMTTYLISSNSIKKEVEKIFKECKTSINDDIKTVERAEKEHIRSLPNTSTGSGPDYTKSSVDGVNKFMVNNDLFIQSSRGNLNNKEVWDKLPDDVKDAVHKQKWANGDTEDDWDYVTTQKIEWGGKPVQFVTKNHYVSKVIVDASTTDKAGTISDKDRSARMTKVLGFIMKAVRTAKEILLQINSISLNALKERSRQYKACLTKIVAYRPKKESFLEESYSEDMFNESSSITNPFDSIVLK